MRNTFALFFLMILTVCANGYSIKYHGGDNSSFQQTVVQGIVTDESGNPMPGVNVVIKGTILGTMTDASGNYSIDVGTQAAVLVFSYIGYNDQEITVGNRREINVQLTPKDMRLEEVVVVGYGTMRKSDLTGAITKVTSETLLERPTQNVLQAMQGKAAGIDIISNLKPGEVPAITVRGNRSITASNAPLYVVDGIPLAVGSIADINPNDIASVEILKDASATAIFGSRGANGVIMITTNKGEKGRVSVTYSNTTSLDSYHSLTDWMDGGEYIDRWRLALMNGRQYQTTTNSDLNQPADIWYPDPTLDVTKMALANDPVAMESVLMGYEWENDEIGGTVKMRPTTPEEQAMGWPAQVPLYNSKNIRSYDWAKAALRQGITQNHQLAVSAGTDISRVYLSFGYLDQLGVQKDQDYKRYSVNVNGDIAANKWLTVGTSINASLSLQNFGIQPPNTSNTGSKDLYSRANDQFPYALAKNPETGEWIKNPGGNLSLWNPLIDIDQAKNERRIGSVLSSLFTEIKFTPWLKYRLNFGAQYRQYRNGAWTGPNATSHLTNKPNTAGYSTNQSFAWVADNLLYFDKTFADMHTVNITLLQSAQEYRYESINASASSMIYDISYWYDLASNLNGKPDGYGTGFTSNTLLSYMARLNYSFMNKYLLTASGRWDGASVLAPGHKWDFFPSFALAWKLQEEGFVQNLSWINELKLRLTYGVTGNSSVDPYITSGPLSRNPYIFGSTAAVGYLPQQVANPLLSWEKTAQWNVGLDFSFLRNRIAGTVEIYKSNTYDLLLNKSLPAVSGYVSKIENIGKTRNRGVELSLSTVNIQKANFRWSTDLNFYRNREEIVELINGKEDMVAQRWFIGHPIQVYYQYENDGIWSSSKEDLEQMALFNKNGHKFYPGTIRVFDQNDDYKITGNDMVILGTNRPKWSGGLTNTFAYKNLELSCFVFARIGQMYFGGYPNSYGGVWPNGRVENDVWDWDNQDAKWPMPNTGSVENTTASMQYNDGSYVIVRNISLSYTLPDKWVKPIQLKNLSVNFQVLNPFIFGGELVKWGINPEDNTNWDIASSNTNPLGGMNNNTILIQSFVFGLKAGF